MKITDIIVEAPGVLAGIKQDYKQGYDTVSKILNLKRWGEDDPTASNTSINKTDLKNAVNLAASGKTIYLKDQEVLKQAYAEIKAGKFEVNQDADQLVLALDAAKRLQKLSPQQQQILTAFAKDL